MIRRRRSVSATSAAAPRLRLQEVVTAAAIFILAGCGGSGQTSAAGHHQAARSPRPNRQPPTRVQPSSSNASGAPGPGWTAAPFSLDPTYATGNPAYTAAELQVAFTQDAVQKGYALTLQCRFQASDAGGRYFVCGPTAQAIDVYVNAAGDVYLKRPGANPSGTATPQASAVPSGRPTQCTFNAPNSGLNVQAMSASGGESCADATDLIVTMEQHFSPGEDPACSFANGDIVCSINGFQCRSHQVDNAYAINVCSSGGRTVTWRTVFSG